ncbi:hypothetical protein, partial [Sphingomonas sp.]|uniref:hypothetical protein n=1 Tax=Sphingomonas sp. TaxID=28214 RepID=UPI00307F1FDA
GCEQILIGLETIADGAIDPGGGAYAGGPAIRGTDGNAAAGRGATGAGGDAGGLRLGSASPALFWCYRRSSEGYRGWGQACVL